MRWINTLALVPLAVVFAAVLARLGDRAERRVAVRQHRGGSRTP